MDPVIAKRDLSAALDGVLAALRIERWTFEDRRDSAVLGELLADSEFAASPIAAMVLAQAQHAARELDGYARKSCPRCGRDFYIVAYWAANRSFDFCRRDDCGN